MKVLRHYGCSELSIVVLSLIWPFCADVPIKYSDFKLTQNGANAELQKWRQSFSEVRPNSSHVAEPNIRSNSSAELRRSLNFGPSLLDRLVSEMACYVSSGGGTLNPTHWLTPVLSCFSSRPRAQVEPFDRFSRFVALGHTWRVLFGVRTICDVIWGKLKNPVK